MFDDISKGLDTASQMLAGGASPSGGGGPTGTDRKSVV